VEIFDLNKRCERAEKSNKDLRSELEELKEANKNLISKIELQSQAIDDLEQYSKGSNLLVHSIPLQNDVNETNLYYYYYLIRSQT